MSNLRAIKRALISVSDKTGIVEFARKLAQYDIELISTGGTAKTLRENGLKVADVADITGFPEMMDGRVKTLHPKIHGGLLALRDNDEHLAALAKHSIEMIDLVVVNLYPFEETIENPDISLEDAIEQIDIGGPAMIRSASKNFRDVAVVVDPNLYEMVLTELEENEGALTFELRKMLATIAFTRTTSYDSAISSFLHEQLNHSDYSEKVLNDSMKTMANFSSEFDADFEDEDEVVTSFLTQIDSKHSAESDNISIFPGEYDIELTKINDLRYGENPHQQAAVYQSFSEFGIANAKQLGGKEMSYNNFVDADAAWNLVSDFDELACAIIKHTNPSGVGLGETCVDAYLRALETDKISAFGGIVAFNRCVDAETAKLITEIFSEVIVAPEFTKEALEIFSQKKNLRILQAPSNKLSASIEYRTISGGILAQTSDNHRLNLDEIKVVTKRKPSDSELKSLLFAWTVCKHVKSNAIVFSNEFQTIGVGAGQMNRADSVRIAAQRAEKTNLALKNSVLASDAFFPFRDGLDEAAKYGISAVIQPGGSVRDDEVIQSANENNLAMIFTGIRHFKH